MDFNNSLKLLFWDKLPKKLKLNLICLLTSVAVLQRFSYIG